MQQDKDEADGSRRRAGADTHRTANGTAIVQPYSPDE
jgi:hypothetical protein